MKLKERTKIVLGVLSASGLVSWGLYALMQPPPKVLILKQKTVAIEYGENISVNPADYLKVSKEQQKLLKEIKVSVDIGKDIYPAVGKYQLKLSYQKETAVVTIVVKDSQAPIFNGEERIEIEQGTNLNEYDFKSLFNATDLSPLKEMTFDLSQVNSNIVGEYLAKGQVEDCYGNVGKKEFVVVISAKAANEESSSTEVSNNVSKKTNSSSKKETATEKKESSSGSNQNSSNTNQTGGTTSKPPTNSEVPEKPEPEKPGTPVYRNIRVTWTYRLGAGVEHGYFEGREDKWHPEYALPEGAYDFSGYKIEYID